MEEYKKVSQETLFNPRRTITNDEYLRYQIPLSGSEVISILESRRETMVQEEYEKLVGFFKSVIDKINQVYNQQLSYIRRNRF